MTSAPSAPSNRFGLRTALIFLSAVLVGGAIGAWARDRATGPAAGTSPVAPAAPARRSGPLPGPLSGSLEDATPLQRRLPEVQMHPMPLGEAIEFLRELSDQNIFVNWRELSRLDPPVDPTTMVPVDLRLNDVTLAQVIAKVLDSLPPIVPPRNHGPSIGFGMRDGIITISTEVTPRGTVTGRWYYVQDLIERSSNTLFDRELLASQEDVEGQTYVERTDSLINLVTNSVAPDTWRDAGGEIGSIQMFGGRLIVQQTPENHQKIDALLAVLRKEP